MFKIIGWFFKASLFALVILVGSHLVKWNGRTVSDQVRSTLSSAEKFPTVKTVKKKSQTLMNDAKDVAGRALSTTTEKANSATEILEQDKAELQALIHEDKSDIE